MATPRGTGEGSPLRQTSPSLVRRAADVLRQLLGVPDYEKYVAHVRDHHPGETPLSREEFTRRRMDERYAKPGSKCC
jgi:uncharacterized short protein YbdD (DUF466 family)